jgi:short-subunit dehydrogenase
MASDWASDAGRLDAASAELGAKVRSEPVGRRMDRCGLVIEVEVRAFRPVQFFGATQSSLDARSVAIDILVNNAGYGLHRDFLAISIERTVDMIQLNITALTELTDLFGRDMATRRSGHILLVASLLGFQAVPAATKAYVLALGEALHDELRLQGVVVTSLCPGHTATGFDAAADAVASPLLRLLTMKPGPVAASGIRALLQGKAMVVAGLANKMATFSNRLIPRSMQRATMRRIMGP